MSLGHFLMAFEGTFLFALLALIVGVGLFKGNIASQVGALYKENDLRRAMAFQIFYIAINVSVIAAPLVAARSARRSAGITASAPPASSWSLGVLIFLAGRPLPAVEDDERADRPSAQDVGALAVARSRWPW